MMQGILAKEIKISILKDTYRASAAVQFSDWLVGHESDLVLGVIPVAGGLELLILYKQNNG